MAIIVPVMEIPITVEIPIAEIQASTGIQASVEAVTQQGVVIREKMYFTPWKDFKGVFKRKNPAQPQEANINHLVFASCFVYRY